MKKLFALFLLINSLQILRAQDYQEGYFQVDDRHKLFYQKTGTGKQVVVIPMGFLMYDDFVRLKSDERTLIFYDMRNRGRSDYIDDTSLISVQHDVEDLEMLRRHFKLEKMDLIGESYLGKMIMLYALKYPTRVRKLVQIGAAPMQFSAKFPDSLDNSKDYSNLNGKAWNELRELRQSGYAHKNPAEFALKSWNDFERWWLVADSASVLKMGPHWGTHIRFRNEHTDRIDRHLQHLFKTVRETDITPEQAKKITVPVLTIHGRKDRNAPFGSGKQWAEQLPNAVLVPVKNAAHMPWIEDPELVFNSINRFLER